MKSKSAPNGRPWTKEDERYLFEHRRDKHEDLARELNRTLAAIRSQLTKRGWAPHRNILNSCTQRAYGGPRGWTPAAGPPCQQCRFHRKKMVVYAQLRTECLNCEARVKWDVFNSGIIRQSADYCESWPNAIEQETVCLI